MVSNLKGRTYEERLAEMGMVTLETRRQRGDMIQTFKIMSGADKVKADTWFNLSSTVERDGAAQTRCITGHLNIQERWASSELRRNFFSLRVIKPWNMVPDNVKEATTVNGFKNGYDDWMSVHQ